jgi:hypothetical protein
MVLWRDCKPYRQKCSAGGDILAGAPAKLTQNQLHYGAIYSPTSSATPLPTTNCFSSAAGLTTISLICLYSWCSSHCLLFSHLLFVLSIPPWSLKARSHRALLPNSSVMLSNACFSLLGSGPSGMSAHLSILTHG